MVTTSQTKLFLDSYLNNFYQNASAEEPFNVHQLESNKNLLKLFLSTQSASIYNSLLTNWLSNYKCASNIESSPSVTSHESANFLDTKAPSILSATKKHIPDQTYLIHLPVYKQIKIFIKKELAILIKTETRLNVKSPELHSIDPR